MYKNHRCKHSRIVNPLGTGVRAHPKFGLGDAIDVVPPPQKCRLVIDRLLRVNHAKLFDKLVDRGFPAEIVKVLSD